MFTAKEIIEHEGLVEMAKKDPRGMIKLVETKYHSQRKEILKAILIGEMGGSVLKSIEGVAKRLIDLTAELDGLVEAHIHVGESPVISKDGVLNNDDIDLGVKLHDACAKYVRVYNKENL